MALPLWLICVLASLAAEAPLPEAPEGMVLVPAGEFVMGSDEGATDEAPSHRVYVSAFYVDVYEVSNAAFAAFAKESGQMNSIEGPWFRYSAQGCLDLVHFYEARHGVPLKGFNGAEGGAERDALRWRAAAAALRSMLEEKSPESGEDGVLTSHPAIRQLIAEQARLPVRGVTWRDASAYAQWAGKRLLTEAEWEKAARGTTGWAYPWGLEWNPAYCHAGANVGAAPAPLGSFPLGASPYGCQDMSGNVWEWVADWYGETAYRCTDGAVDPRGPEGLENGQLPGPSTDIDMLRSPLQGRESNTRKVIRGGGWGGPEAQARFNLRCARRLWSNPSYGHLDVGFRCGKDAEGPRGRS